MADPRRRKLADSEVNRLVDAGKTPRFRALEMLQGHYDCTAYQGRPSFWDDSVPLQERAPCIIYPFVARAVKSNISFAMGEGKFPSILSMSSEDDDLDSALGLNKDQSQTLDAFNSKLIQVGKLDTAFRLAAKMAQASKSVAMVLSFRKGLPSIEAIWAKLCTPTFDPADPAVVTSLSIRYRYTEPYRDPQSGEWWTVVKEYLRVIDAVADTVYLPVEIWDVADRGPATPDPAQTKKHGFGFCPVHWYAHLKDSASCSDFDGKAIHQMACSQVEALDFSISQRYRAALYCGDPQWVLTGVAPDDGPGAPGRRGVPAVPDGAKTGWDAAIYGARGGSAIKKGPGEIWRTESADAVIDLKTLPGDALKAISDQITDLLSKLSDSLGVVIVDGSTLKGGGDLSGRTLAFVFSSQINSVNEFREDFGRQCLLPVLSIFYRMLVALKGKGIYLPGVKKVLPILAGFNAPLADGTTVWIDPQLKLKWGDYFEPSDVDEATRSATARADYAAGIITLATAVEHVRSIYVISNVDQYVESLQAEVAQKQQDAIANAQAMAATVPPKPGAGGPTASQSPSAQPPAKTPKPKRVDTKGRTT